MRRRLFILGLFIWVTSFALRVRAQDAADTQALIKQLLQRLDVLEEQNRQLLQEVHALREEVDGARTQNPNPSATVPRYQPTLEDRVGVNEQRIKEQAQTKVEASQKFPVSLNGMVLFNAFLNSATADVESPTEYGLVTGPNRAGATVRQTLLGLEFQGPALPGNGRVNAFASMDFWGGPATPGLSWLRLRRADISLDWPNRSFTVGQDKPLISPYQPDSLAEVAIPPLAGSGNLWLWLPQARYEERLHLGGNDGITAQVAVMQTGENYEAVPSQYSTSLEAARPGLEGRVAFWHKFDDTRRLEVGSGFHISTTHVAGSSVPSHIASLDWRFIPWKKLDFTGTIYTGQNVASLGALGNSFVILRNGTVHPVQSAGAWGQISFPVSSRLTVNLFGGLEDDRGSYSSAYSVSRDLTYASNIMYHFGPNVVVGLEGLQTRTRLFSGRTELINHYDLALGYLF